MVEVKCDVCREVISKHNYCSDAVKKNEHEGVRHTEDILAIALNANHICQRCRNVADKMDWESVVRNAMCGKNIYTALDWDEGPVEEAPCGDS